MEGSIKYLERTEKQKQLIKLVSRRLKAVIRKTDLLEKIIEFNF